MRVVLTITCWDCMLNALENPELLEKSWPPQVLFPSKLHKKTGIGAMPVTKFVDVFSVVVVVVSVVDCVEDIVDSSGVLVVDDSVVFSVVLITMDSVCCSVELLIVVVDSVVCSVVDDLVDVSGSIGLSLEVNSCPVEAKLEIVDVLDS